MAKKKLSLKPVQRGFATTSVPSKKPKDEPKPEEIDHQPVTVDSASTQQKDGERIEDTSQGNTSAAVKEDWDDEKAIEEAALQALVDRLHEKAEKEVVRILKTIEFDKRLAASFPKLEVNQNIRDRVLELALEEAGDDDGKEADALPEVRHITVPRATVDSDRILLRMFVAYHVLSQLGFTDERIVRCLEHGLGDGQGWEEGLEWMWLHLSEDECLRQGEFARKEEPTLPAPDDPLIEPILETTEIPKDNPNATTPAPASSASTVPSSPTQVSLFQSAESDSEGSDSDTDPDLNKANESWAQLMLELDSLKIAVGGGPGKKGKKGKVSGVVLETPEIRRVKEKMSKVEKEYLFNRKDADSIFKTLKAQRDVEALEARLQGKPVPTILPSGPDETKDAVQEELEPTGDTMEDEDDSGGLFGNMLDEPVVPTPIEDPRSTITVRSMPIPKQFSFAGNIPKNLLKAALAKSHKQAILTYVRLSGHSRAARAALEIRWSTSRRRVWRMEDIACDDMQEAENYVSTLALNEMSGCGELGGVNWRSMPLDYRDLWETLERARQVRLDAARRETWAKIQAIVEKKAVATIAGVDAPAPVSLASTSSYQPTIGRSERLDESLQAAFRFRQSSVAYQSMLRHRNTLPIAAFRDEIIDTLESTQIMVLSGETGCGKSTQLPSFILEDQLAKGRPCKIFVTEPRRISAISLAQRVSQELGDAPGQMGTNSSLVGYSIRLEAKVSASTRLAFVTNGIALRMLESGSGGGNRGTAFDEVTHIIVDEVHERSIDSDFLLIVLKSLMQQRPDLKVVLMSATLDAEKISSFFGGCPYLAVPGRTFPVRVNYLEDAVELTGWHIDESSQYAIRTRNIKSGVKQLEWTEEGAKADTDSDSDEDTPSDPSKLSATRYSARTVSTVNLLDSRQIAYDLIVRLLERICFEDEELQRFSAATLIFMPGLAEIRKLNDMIQGHPAFGAYDFVIYPLHSSISSEGQSAVFDIPPPGVRKIVISTNIAETGVTIPDITCVIDSGKHREMRYDEKRQISRLVETYIARSNAKQRRGRAGRVQEGLAFHLFTKARHDTQIAEHPIPEMLRLSLQDLALRIKILRVKLGNSIEDVLSKALDPPSPTNIQRAIASLVEVKALTANEEITPMGRLLSKLPMDVHLGKFLLVAALFKCLDPALTIAATLNSKSPFMTPFGFEAQADLAKKSFAVGNSDFLTIANVFSSWRRASDTPAFIMTFCRKNFVSQQNLQQIEELRQQLLAYLIDSSFVSTTQLQKQEINQARYSRGSRTRFVTVPRDLNVNAENPLIMGAALAAGLYPKLLSLDGNALKTIINQQTVAIHPSSINFRTPKSDFGTNYLAYFTIMQSKKLYAWETGPVDDRALAMLCGDTADFRLSASLLQLDRKIRYRVEPKTAMAIKVLRENFALAMSARLSGKALSEVQEKWFELGLKCLMTGVYQDEQQVGVV
ncbi:P-loop containing nucleoside triphosphate hydrolase protein [Naematelia encephala]|uniref:RNA helicase n=1 Tax=Naematelia encephala TaxID=71784 RepID=A0A1Y2BDB3_9TREE|nr:P-loop containing nucleoside triphosphate hydrolase protein [Naematelia encephala]